MSIQEKTTMKVKDFEEAIEALGSDIVIDEMKLRHSYVRQVNGGTNMVELILIKKNMRKTYSLHKKKMESSTVLLVYLSRER